MKTNQKMIVRLGAGLEMEVWHKSGMGNLTKLWEEVSRKERSRTPDLHKWVHSARTNRFLDSTSEIMGIPADALIEVKGKGRNSATWAHVNVVISAMAYLSPRVEAIVIAEFVRNRILEWRDESGDEFIELNAMLAAQAMDIIGRPASSGDYSLLAKIIRSRVSPQGPGWNLATASELAERARIESQLSSVLRLGLVSDWSQLKALAVRV